jgi:hypothetical protein
LAFISKAHSHITYYSKEPKTIVIINTWDDLRNGPANEEIDDDLDWETYSQNWTPHWELRWSEGIEFGLPKFSANTSVHVLSPQHVIGQTHQASTIASRQKLVDMGDITRVRSPSRSWFCSNTLQWRHNLDHSYYIINRMRTLQSWPQQDPYATLFQINYFQYEAMWDCFCLWTDIYKYYYCMVKFSDNFMLMPEPSWFNSWWKKSGLNSSAIHPEVINTGQMLYNLNLSNKVYKLG